jgi:cyclase
VFSISNRRNLPGRRDFLGLMTGAAGVSLAQSAFGQTPAQSSSSAITAIKHADNFLQITGAGSNVLAVVGPDSVLLVDGGAAEHSADLMKFVGSQASGKPVKVAFNTHWHPDHVGSNEALGKAGAKIIAHAYTKEWLSTEIDWGWQHKTFEPLPAVALPNETFYDSGKLTFGKEPVEYAHMQQAHTDGDLYVYFPGPNILMAGDVVSAGSYPVLDWTTNGWIRGMVNAQKTILQIANDNTKIIPGTGPAQTKAEVQALSDMCNTVGERILKLMKMGMGPKEIVAAKPTTDFDAKYGDPELFLLNGYRGIWGHVRELGGIV